MSRLRNRIDAADAHIRTLRIVILLLALLIAGQQYATSRLPRDITLHYPPDLRGGAVLRLDEVPPANVYLFAHHVFQQLNHWPEDGEKDYGRNIYRLAAYLTPKFRAQLTAELDLKGRRGELTGRVRTVQQLPGHGYEERRVDVRGNGVWTVWLDLDLEESVDGMAVKHSVIRYPLRVVRFDVDREKNPFGLALDGYAGQPERLPEDDGAPPLEKERK